jgi:hypothetical protein
MIHLLSEWLGANGFIPNRVGEQHESGNRPNSKGFSP